MELLNRSLLAGRAGGAGAADPSSDGSPTAPVTVLQIGEGNFLRGFFDWMIQTSRDKGLFTGTVAVTQPRPTGRAKIEALADQDGLYTLVTRGLENGKPVERREMISVFAEAFDPYTDWPRFAALAVRPELRFLVSNTTEAGLAYSPEPLGAGPIHSFPGKAAYVLYKRYEAFGGAPDKGLILLPCELLERNGDILRELVLRYAADWGLPDGFADWVRSSNLFLNSLVDRIVTGYPEEAQAEAWFAEWGYRDAMLTTAEPYHLWAIEGDPSLDDELPLAKAGLNVHWTDDLKPFQERKVRLLNGVHTWMAPIGLLHGVETVRELLEHPSLGQAVREAAYAHIVPALPYPEADMRAYADAVFERFANPYIRHRLADIAMNSLSKFKVRLLPSLAYYAERGETIPARLAEGFAGLLRYYRVEADGSGGFAGRTLGGEPYAVRDDAEQLALMADIWREAAQRGETAAVAIGRLLAETRLWERDLSGWHGLAEAIAAFITGWEKEVQA